MNLLFASESIRTHANVLVLIFILSGSSRLDEQIGLNLVLIETESAVLTVGDLTRSGVLLANLVGERFLLLEAREDARSSRASLVFIHSHGALVVVLEELDVVEVYARRARVVRLLEAEQDAEVVHDMST